MKLFSLVVLLALHSTHAPAADYYQRCKTELSQTADGLSSYVSGQSVECTEEIDKPAGQRNNQAINRSCKNPRQLAALKNRAYAVCQQCRRLNNDSINEACTDNGASSFISAVGSL